MEDDRSFDEPGDGPPPCFHPETKCVNCGEGFTAVSGPDAASIGWKLGYGAGFYAGLGARDDEAHNWPEDPCCYSLHEFEQVCPRMGRTFQP